MVYKTPQTHKSGPGAKETPFILSSQPEKAMQQMMDTIDQLKALYAEENKALKRYDTKRFSTLQKQKLALAQNYQSGSHQIMQRKEEFKDIRDTLRKKLIKKQEEFSAVTAENLTLLERTEKAVNRLNERIMNTARQTAQKEELNYKPSGELSTTERPVSIGLNESA